ncbi:MAG: hypothetical protein NVSMB64_27310 [Candidatus Velthaea sp.]
MDATPAVPSPDYENRLYTILSLRDWEGLRDFSREQNQVPEDVYDQGRHFWEVLLHKLTVNRFDLLGLHDESRAWLEANGYTTDLGGY